MQTSATRTHLQWVLELNAPSLTTLDFHSFWPGRGKEGRVGGRTEERGKEGKKAEKGGGIKGRKKRRYLLSTSPLPPYTRLI
jgi:hypothetical protein